MGTSDYTESTIVIAVLLVGTLLALALSFYALRWAVQWLHQSFHQFRDHLKTLPEAKKLSNLAIPVIVVMLIAAMLPWPYFYYQILRLACFGIVIWLLWHDWRPTLAHFTLAMIGVLYNPLVPIHLTREIWSVLNPLTVIAFVWFWWSTLRPATRVKDPAPS
ncbi:DUF6804 family protein [Bosea sp. 685]|uniref:DUF6804 family protein n=1 Tax=Bosea sp. 685 TaxID=3080057 RepID=UPI002892FD42|nr:DUF6804 family protein [Bosea sp. 685]WNJ93026.1 hypothetical protein RMR04_12350 [Bosea sp. 685]